jgi:hypothetical protein
MKALHQIIFSILRTIIFATLIPINFTAPAFARTPAGHSESQKNTTVSAPRLLLTLKDRWEEAWLGSPAVADIDADGKPEIIVPRGKALVVWNSDGTLRWKFNDTDGRIWASPVVADFRDDSALEIAFAARKNIFMLNSEGKVLSGFPITWRDEMRSLAAGDIDGDGKPELIATTTRIQNDIINAWNADGSTVNGFPPNESGTSGCDEHCYVYGGFDQNIAVGDLDGDEKMDIVAPHDNAYASFHKGTGEAFDANPMFKKCTKTPGVRYLHNLDFAIQGWAPNEETALQAHFTNTAPAITDVDGDVQCEIILLASVQNASQSDRFKGVALWIVHPDASRLEGWETPFHVPEYLSGLWDFSGTNIVAATNQVSIADIDTRRSGPEFIFAGFDGRIHAVTADKSELWSFCYTTDPNVLTGGLVVGDLSNDDIPEIVFNTYSPDDNKGALFILDAGGNKLHQVSLPRRGAMPVPTLADIDGNGTVEIVVSLKDAEDKVASVLVYTIVSSQANNLPWPTGRGNLLRNGWWKNPGTNNSIQRPALKALDFQLFQNFPNPFNSHTVIKFILDKSGRVSLKVYDCLGRKVALPINNEVKSRGLHQVAFNASGLATGIYFYHLQTETRTAIRKLLLVK